MGTPSSSKERDPGAKGRRPSSTNVNRGSKTCSPIFPFKGEVPKATDIPEKPTIRGRSSTSVPLGTSSTGGRPWGAGTTRSPQRR